MPHVIVQNTSSISPVLMYAARCGWFGYWARLMLAPLFVCLKPYIIPLSQYLADARWLRAQWCHVEKFVFGGDCGFQMTNHYFIYSKGQHNFKLSIVGDRKNTNKNKFSSIAVCWCSLLLVVRQVCGTGEQLETLLWKLLKSHTLCFEIRQRYNGLEIYGHQLAVEQSCFN